jgi:four helix bundle protein
MKTLSTRKYFDHEKLIVYSKAIEFISWLTDVLQEIPKSLSVWDQLDRASTSIPLNIAEGTGKFTASDKCRYYDSARGSALECAACLDVLVSKKLLTPERIVPAKELLSPIVSMLFGLIKSAAPNRLYEDSPEYGREGSSSSVSSSKS